MILLKNFSIIHLLNFKHLLNCDYSGCHYQAINIIANNNPKFLNILINIILHSILSKSLRHISFSV